MVGTSDRATFVSVENLLGDIGSGLGRANRNLWSESFTKVGVLAVKTATVTVNLEMTSGAVERREGIDLPSPLPLLGAKTFSLTSSERNEATSNRATIVFEVVSVAPPEEHKPPEEDKPPKTIDAPPADDALAKNIRLAIGLLRDRLATARLPEEVKREILRDLGQIEEMVKQGQATKARDALIDLARHYELPNLNFP